MNALTSAEPPLEMNSSGTPVSGSSALTPPTFSMKWAPRYMAAPLRMILYGTKLVLNA